MSATTSYQNIAGIAKTLNNIRDDLRKLAYEVDYCASPMNTEQLELMARRLDAQAEMLLLEA